MIPSLERFSSLPSQSLRICRLSSRKPSSEQIKGVQPHLGVPLPAVQSIEMCNAVRRQDNRFAVDHERRFAEPESGVALHDEPIAIVLYLVKPVGAGGTSVPRVGMHGWQSSIRNVPRDKAKTRVQHTIIRSGEENAGSAPREPQTPVHCWIRRFPRCVLEYRYGPPRQ